MSAFNRAPRSALPTGPTSPQAPATWRPADFYQTAWLKVFAQAFHDHTILHLEIFQRQ